MLQTEIAFHKKSSCQTSEPKNFRIREYVSAIRERDPERCWPFESICEFKNLDTLEGSKDTIAPELPQVRISKGKEIVYEAPTAFELGLTEKNSTVFETEIAFALLEISSGNKAHLETARAFELEVPKGNKTRSAKATAFELELTKGNNTGYEFDTATEIVTSKEVNDGATELVNLSDSENEESVNGGMKTEITVINDDANSGKTSKEAKKRKFRLLSEVLRDLAGPNVESAVHFADKVDENTDKSDEDFTITDEDDSDDDTLGMFLRKRKAVKITSRSTGSRNYHKKKKRAPKPSNRGPKGSKARTKRANPHPPHATRKLADAFPADVALAANRKRRGSSYDRRGGTGQSVVGQPVAEVGGSKDPGVGLGPVVGPPSKRRSLVCVLNKNPTEFTMVGPGNQYMRKGFN